MIVTCPRCFATYNVPAQAVGGKGRLVRCSSCRFEWTEAAPPAEAIAALAPEFTTPRQTAVAAEEPVPESDGLSPDEFAARAEALAEAALAQSRMSAPAAPEPLVPQPSPKARASTTRSLPPKENILKRMGSKAAWGIFVVVTLVCALILLREPLGKRSLTLTDLYEDIGLPIESPEDWFRFEGMKLEKNEIAGATVFNIHGLIVNQSRREREVPNLKLFWRSVNGDIGPMVIIVPNTNPLAMGATTAFSGELKGVNASRGGEVKVTFVTPLEASILKPGVVADPMFKPSNPPAVPAPQAAPAQAAPQHPSPETSHEDAATPAAH